MIKKRLMFELQDVTDKVFQIWKDQEEEINQIALKHNVIRSNRIDDDCKHTTSVDIEIPNQEAQVHAMIEISHLYAGKMSETTIKVTQQILQTDDESEIIISGSEKQVIKESLQSIKEILTTT